MCNLKEFYRFINPILNRTHSLWEMQEPETKLCVHLALAES